MPSSSSDRFAAPVILIPPLVVGNSPPCRPGGKRDAGNDLVDVGNDPVDAQDDPAVAPELPALPLSPTEEEEDDLDAPSPSAFCHIEDSSSPTLSAQSETPPISDDKPTLTPSVSEVEHTPTPI